MLFYEPAFVTFLSAFYALYLVAGQSLIRKWILLLASIVFYVWGEPVFVLILLASTVIDYALSFHLTEPASRGQRRLALAVGLVMNLGILAVYKYADFAIANLDALLSPFGAT
jgi:alginate O-acetyltransferase complex protein AlgI